MYIAAVQDKFLEQSERMTGVQVVYSSNESRSAALLITSATVHAGASGGAVVSSEGSVVGITTSNARHSASGSTIPNWNFAVAADALQPLWALAAQPSSLTKEALRRLDTEDAVLARLFSLSSPPEQQRPISKPESKTHKQGSARLAELLLQKGLTGQNDSSHNKPSHTRSFASRL